MCWFRRDSLWRLRYPEVWKPQRATRCCVPVLGFNVFKTLGVLELVFAVDAGRHVWYYTRRPGALQANSNWNLTHSNQSYQCAFQSLCLALKPRGVLVRAHALIHTDKKKQNPWQTLKTHFVSAHKHEWWLNHVSKTTKKSSSSTLKKGKFQQFSVWLEIKRTTECLASLAALFQHWSYCRG